MRGSLFSEWADSHESGQREEEMCAFIEAIQRGPDKARESVDNWLESKKRKHSQLRWVGLKQTKKKRVLLKDKRNNIHFAAFIKPFPFAGIWSPDLNQMVPYPLDDTQYFPASIGKAYTRAFPKDIVKYMMANFFEPEELWQAAAVCKTWRVYALDESVWVRWRNPLFDAMEKCRITSNWIIESSFSTRMIYAKITGRRNPTLYIRYLYHMIELGSWGPHYESTDKKNQMHIIGDGRYYSVAPLFNPKPSGYIILRKSADPSKELHIDIKLANRKRGMLKRPISQFTPLAINGVRNALKLSL